MAEEALAKGVELHDAMEAAVRVREALQAHRQPQPYP